MKENKMDEAKAKFKELDSKYGDTKTGRRAKRIDATSREIIGHTHKSVFWRSQLG